MIFKRYIIPALILVICLGAALFLEWRTSPPPRTRAVHIEAFRYGTQPYLIRAGRGDELILTFSTKDTGHSFFLQDYGLDAKISPASEQVEVRDPARVDAEPQRLKEVRLKAGMSGWWGRLASLSRYRCHVYCGPMHGFEQGDLIVRPNWLFSGSLGLLAALLIIGLVRVFYAPSSPQPPLMDGKTAVLNPPGGRLDRLLKWRPLQFVLTLPFLAGLVMVIMTGLLGTKVSGRNAAIMFTWIFSMSALTILLVPLGGRIWCAVCPLPSLGEYLQRGATTGVRIPESGALEGKGLRNRFFGLGLAWPKFLSNRWLQFSLFMVLGAFSASLAGQPKATAWTLIIVVLTALVAALIFRLRAFCRYLCPIAAYLSIFSQGAPLGVRSRDEAVCRRCRERSCLKGGLTEENGGWACPYGLLVPSIKSNADCGLCAECFKSCPHGNVALEWRTGARSFGLANPGRAWQAIALTVLAAAYSLTVHSPWPGLRDMVNMVDKADWSQFGLYAGVLWITALGAVPLLFLLLSALGRSLAGLKEATDAQVFSRTMASILPLGLALWAVFFVDTLMSNFTFVLMTLSDPFGWGWDLLGTAGMPWLQIWPSGIPWIQAALLLIGAGLSFSGCYRRWLGLTGLRRKALWGAAPVVAAYAALTAGMLTFLTNY